MTGPTYNANINDALVRITKLRKAVFEARHLMEAERLSHEEYNFAFRSINAEIDYCVDRVKTAYKSLTI